MNCLQEFNPATFSKLLSLVYIWGIFLLDHYGYRYWPALSVHEMPTREVKGARDGEGNFLGLKDKFETECCRIFFAKHGMTIAPVRIVYRIVNSQFDICTNRDFLTESPVFQNL